MESSERLLLVRTLEFRVSVATDSIYFSCFNAFSRVDVRVDVKIPGGVHAYVIDLRGERCVPFIGRAIVLTDLQAQCDPRDMAGNLPFRHPSRYLVLG